MTHSATACRAGSSCCTRASGTRAWSCTGAGCTASRAACCACRRCASTRARCATCARVSRPRASTCPPTTTGFTPAERPTSRWTHQGTLRRVTLLLRHADVEDLLSLDEVIQALRGGLREQADGLAQVPPRTTIDSSSRQGWLRVMPVILNGSGLMGFKAMHATPGVGVRYLVACYDLSSGALLALIDADWLTQVRTACTAAIGTDALARRDVEQVAVIGSSARASMLLAAVARVRPFKRLKVFSPTPANRERFAQAAGQQYGVEALAVDSGEAAAQGADLVLSAIRATGSPAVWADWLSAGVH